MRKSYFSAVIYAVLGLLAGVYFRELTKAQEFAGDTQLSVLHTHLLVLGTLVFLLVLLFERVAGLSRSRWFGWFFWTYNAGMLVTVGGMAVNGTMTVLGEPTGAALAGISGLGHILLTVGLVCLFTAIHRTLLAPGHPQRR
ncbi:DUF2871 domain-containing protein [Saccharopolyspora sp. NFXS83]|uniref:DUF2871 domain-containing protein n=1 Tax=Saccharopolyspora sp. NFXS83 TaxID=2993560 RepID=UPI00224A6CD5|nr:DUF2871 domain-containing protein [Saccharopolyspora sp. NFXS83]MCX2731177.1 DUF2871 domain-containing protein [Saccharopolyspora sp. NFXS83]